MARRKNDEIKVHVANYGAGRALMLRYRCPKTGKQITRSSGTTNRKEAGKEAGKWEDELRNGRYKPASKTTWEEFRNKYEAERVSTDMRDSSAVQVSAVFDAVERIVDPHLLSDVDGEAVELLKRTLREERQTRQEGEKIVVDMVNRSEATVRNHLVVLRAGLNWAKRKNILNEVPQFELPPVAKNPSKGRAITLEEFERMIGKIPEKRKAYQVKRWERFMWGLWWSGLRLEEALTLTWDDRNAPHIDLAGDRSTITIPAHCQKNGEYTVGPIVPEFYEFLSETPEADRRGYVFDMPFRDKYGVSRVVSRFGKAAGVKVSDGARTGKVKYASCHDFRRSFGLRWAVRVMPALLQSLMRHADISTTMKYYVGNNVEAMTRAVWQAFRASETADLADSKRGHNSGNMTPANTR